MWDYIYNEKFWTWSLEITQLGIQSWTLPLLTVFFIKTWTPAHRRILLFVSFSIFMEHMSSDDQLESLFHPTSNAPWYHLLTPVLFFFMSNLFLPYLAVKRFRWMRWALPLSFLLAALPGILDEVKFYQFPGFTVGLYSIVGMIIVLTYFLHLFKNITVKRLELLPMFWVASGVLVYLAGNFLLWTSTVLITYDGDFFYSIYRLNGGLTILLNCCLTIALLVDQHTEKTSIRA